MSRIGRMPVIVPMGVAVEITGNQVTVKGPKGVITKSFHPEMSITLAEGQVRVTRPSDEGFHRSLHGLTRSLLANMVQGVTKGFQKDLEIGGVGYRAQLSGGKLVLALGYSHPVEIAPPSGISFAVEGQNRVSVMGIDKELVGEVAANIRQARPPEPYKGKGIHYVGERLRHKAGKAGKVGAKK